MKKTFLLISILLSTCVFSQRMSKSITQLNTGMFTNTHYDNVTPLYIGLDYGVAQELSIGGQFDMYLYNGDSLKYLNGHANYHLSNLFNASGNLDLYGGLALIMELQGENDIDLSGQIGTRFFFNRKIGMNIEIDFYDHHTPIKLGISFNI